MNQKEQGILYGVGVGPGDPELMTLKSVRIIQNSDILFLPSEVREKCYAYQIAAQAVEGLEDKPYLCHEFPMTKTPEIVRTAHHEILIMLKDVLNQGKQVAFLTIGDPSVYSTYYYVQEQLLAQGYRVEMISGVPSFCAAAARLGIALGIGSEEIHIISGNEITVPNKEEDVHSERGSGEKERMYSGTRIYMKSGRKLQLLLKQLQLEARVRDVSIYTVANCGLEDEKVIRIRPDTRLDDLEMGYLTIVIVKENEGGEGYGGFLSLF